MVNRCFCFNRPLAAVVHRLQDFACAASAVAARWGVVVPHWVLPAGFIIKPPEMPQAHLCPRGIQRFWVIFLWGLGKVTSPALALVFVLGLMVGVRLSFVVAKACALKNHIQTWRCDKLRVRKSPL